MNNLKHIIITKAWQPANIIGVQGFYNANGQDEPFRYRFGETRLTM